MQKGLSEPALPSSPVPFDYAEKFRTDSRRSRSRSRSRGGYFRGNLDRDKTESTQLPRNTIPREIFAKKLSARSNSFRRHRFRTTSEVSISKDRSPILARSILVFPALDRILPLKRRSFYLTSCRRGMFRHIGPVHRANGYREKDGSSFTNLLELVN